MLELTHWEANSEIFVPCPPRPPNTEGPSPDNTNFNAWYLSKQKARARTLSSAGINSVIPNPSAVKSAQVTPSAPPITSQAKTSVTSAPPAYSPDSIPTVDYVGNVPISSVPNSSFTEHNPFQAHSHSYIVQDSTATTKT